VEQRPRPGLVPSTASEIVVIRSTSMRLLAGVLGLSCLVAFGRRAVDGSIAFLPFAIVGAIVLLEAICARIEVDRLSGTVSSTRALRAWTGRTDEIVAVGVFRKGGIALRLRTDDTDLWAGVIRGWVWTGVYPQISGRPGEQGRAARLAAELGVPLDAPTRHFESGWEPARITPSWPIKVGVPLCGAALVAILVVAALS